MKRPFLELSLCLGTVVHYFPYLFGHSPLFLCHAWAALNVLALLHILDIRVQSILTQTGDQYALEDHDLSSLSAELGLTYNLCSEVEHYPELVAYGTITEEDQAHIKHLLSHPHLATESLISDPVLLTDHNVVSWKDALEIRTLPYLSPLNGRPQLGLFARYEIAPQSLFLWQSDLGLIQRGELEQKTELDELIADLNRRPILRTSHYEIFQGAGVRQRSNPLVLVNFSWCNTEGTPSSESVYRLLPPHDLGQDNCHFATVLKPQQTAAKQDMSICSGLITHRTIFPGQQLLAFTGKGSSLRAVTIRRSISALLTLARPAIIIAPWLRWLSLS